MSETPAARYASVDALRGITVAAMLLVNNPGDWGHVYAPLLHAHWHGCTPTDLIFPMFLFIVGVSITLALMPRLERGDAPSVLARPVLVRAARIVGLGLLLHLCALWAFDLAHYRVMGVLQRIGLCFAAAGLLALHARPRTQWLVLAALLVGYGALLAAGGSYEPFVNLASRVDHALLGVHVYQLDPASGRGHDPEGLVSTLGALATTVLGMRAGDWLRRGDLRALWLGGAAALAIGLAWSWWQPFNKNLWTPSYVLWTGGIACWVLAVVHWLVDRQGLPALGRAFGVNAIAAYAGSAFMLYALVAGGWLEPLYRLGFADWMTPRLGPYAPSLAFAIAVVVVWWVVVRVLDARRIYFKI
ncbi:heparan-alpha-glucosaminide N-acetyltransferase domain-containing protein [Lysobacter sp. S4-A87]|uniref:acyltransferase family protein n=1 Tax=Lysobacter sp. S4-A87 TaxID=2925843 RepID=UPI001F52E6A4|nr:heparan-alpha-glucosaminide N-acetyltransferase domain-containing protein [Lysobacter sp. S4-A87]UNK49056.1 heparan-alpha-glucosaminide N-acetyltransferase domain-containing protein [Lysobacter sp. S4-A87]